MAGVDRSSFLHLYSSEDKVDDDYKVSISNNQAQVKWAAAAAGAQKIQLDFSSYEFRKADDSYFSLESRFGSLETDTTGADNAAAITALQNDLAAEATSRLSGDTTNGNAISAEVVARTDADGVVQADVDGNETDGDAATLLVQTNVDAEAAARVAAVAAEASRAGTAEASLQSQISSLLSNTDATALNSLAELVTAFESADSSISGVLSALSARVAAAEEVINEALGQNLGP